MSDERRNAPRHNASDHLSVYDSISGKFLGELVNMSSDGIMLLTDTPIKASTRIKVMIKLNEEIMGHKQIELLAECRWCRKNVTLNRWESGYKTTLTELNRYLMQFICAGFELLGWGDDSVRDVKTTEIANRRVFTRFDLEQPLFVFKFDSYHEIGRLTNLSTGGVQIVTSTPIEEGNKFKCRVKLPGTIFQKEFLELTLKCVRCRAIVHGNQYDTGHMMEKLSEDDSAILLHLMIHHAKKQSTNSQIKRVH